MIKTIMVHGSDGKVMAPFAKPGIFIKGKRREIVITKVDESEREVPLMIRNAVVGMKISTIFTGAEINKHLREGSQIDPEAMIAYTSELIETLKQAGKLQVARELQCLCPDPLDMYVFHSKTFQVISD